MVESALAAQTAEARQKQADAESELERALLEREELADRLSNQEDESAKLEVKLKSEAAEKTELGRTVSNLELKVKALEESQALQRQKGKRRFELALGGIFLILGTGSWRLPFERVQFLTDHANLLQVRLALVAAFELLAVGQFVPKLQRWVWGVVFADLLFGLWFALGTYK